jgi:hypothetical protein
MDFFEEYKHLFQKPWCPIYGDVPRSESVDEDPLKEFGEIVNEARFLFGISHDIATFPYSNYPTVEEVEEILENDDLADLSVNDVVMIRDIFKEGRSIEQHTANNNQGRAIEGRPIHRFIDQTIRNARWIVNPRCGTTQGHLNEQKYRYNIKEAPDHWILAALAISDARSEAYGFVLHNRPIHFAKAYALLRAAQIFYDSMKYQNLNNKHQFLAKSFGDLQENHEAVSRSFEKQRSGFLKANEDRKRETQKRNEVYIKWYKSIKSEREQKGLPIKDTDIADSILTRLRTNPEKFPINEVKIVEQNPLSHKSLLNIFSKFK